MLMLIEFQTNSNLNTLDFNEVLMKLIFKQIVQNFQDFIILFVTFSTVLSGVCQYWWHISALSSFVSCTNGIKN